MIYSPPKCPKYDAQNTPMTEEDLVTYFGQVQQHEDEVAECYRLSALRWSDAQTQLVFVLDKDGAPQPGVSVIYRLAGGGKIQRAVTDAHGRVEFEQIDEATYYVPSQQGPMAVYCEGNHDAVIHCGKVKVHKGPDRHLNVTMKWGRKGEYWEEPPPLPPPPPDDCDATLQHFTAEAHAMLDVLLKKYVSG